MNLILLKANLLKTLNSFKQIIPVILGVILFLSLIIVVTLKSFYAKFFTGNRIIVEKLLN